MSQINRLNRKSYAVALVISILIITFGFQLDFLLYTFTGTDFDSAKFGMPFLLLSLVASVAYSVAAGIKRLHDINESGWYILAAMVPLAGLVIALPMLFKKGTEGSNKYGKPVEGLFVIGWSNNDPNKREPNTDKNKPNKPKKKQPTNKVLKRLVSLLVILTVVGPVYVVTHWDSDDNPLRTDTSASQELRQTIIDGVTANGNGLTTADGECIADVLIGYHGVDTLTTLVEQSATDDIYNAEVRPQLLNRCEIEFGQ